MNEPSRQFTPEEVGRRETGLTLSDEISTDAQPTVNSHEHERDVPDNMLAVVAYEGEAYTSEYPGVRITNRGLILPPDMSIEAWSDFGHKLVRAEQKIQWLLGDWFNHGTDKWGEDAYSVFDDYQYESIVNMGRVAREFADPDVAHHVVAGELVPTGIVTKAYRREKLTWSHHRELLAIKENGLRSELLDRAEAERWSVRQLHDEVYHLKSVIGMTDPPYEVETADEFIAEWSRRAAQDGVDSVEETVHRLCDPAYDGSTRILNIILARQKAALKVAEKT